MPIGKYRDLLRSRGFQYFLWTQFLSAFDDNLYEFVVSLFAIDVALRTGAGAKYLSVASAVFMLPYLLFSGYAGHFADVFSKRKVLIAAKAFEIVVMLFGLAAFVSGNIELMLSVLFLMGLRSTFFSPAKYGIVPEIVPDRDLSRANGLLEMTTFVAIILGQATAGLLYHVWKGAPWNIGLLLVALAAGGVLPSLGIPKVAASGAREPFRANPWGEIDAGLRRLYRQKPLWLTVLGISYFFFLGTLLKMDLLLLGKERMGLDDLRASVLVVFAAVGIGAGSMAAGRLSGDKVELGLVPLGSMGMGLFSLILSGAAASWWGSASALALLGFANGLFVVPLNAYLQHRSGRDEKGRLIATNNFLNIAGALLASPVLWGLHDKLHVPADGIMLVFGIFTFAATLYSLVVLPDFLIRFCLWMLTHTIYRIRIVGQENVPFRGPALLVCNHMSHVDGFLVGACVQRFIRFLVYRPYYEMRAFHWFLRLAKAIPVAPGGRHEVSESLERARAELSAGHVVCIFAEGSISRTGNMLPFRRGFERIMDGLDVPIIPVHLDRLWGSVFSFKNGRFFWKWPERIPYPVTVSFGRPLPATAKAHDVRQEIMELSAAAVHYRRTRRDLLHLRFLRTAKRRWFSLAMADSSGRELSYGRALIGSLLLARWIRRHCAQDRMIGMLFPASVGGALANIGALLGGRIPVNLNFTVGAQAMLSALAQCEIRTIVTSRLFLAKAKLEEREGMVFLEDVLAGFTALDRARATALALLPARALERLFNPEGQDPDYLATVVFSSGSTGEPKGVLLSHHNILSDIEALGQVFWVTREDRFLGVLPFFHSFGFTCTLWFPLVCGFAVAYHPNPLDAKVVGEMVGKYKLTFLLSTPTFYSTYLRKCSPEEFASLRFALVGAEKLRDTIARAFQEKYGLELCEGYGCTEMAPVVSANVLNVVDGRERQTGFKRGTVGHPIPGVVAKVVDVVTGAPVPPGAEGLLLVKGPNRMIGYLGDPARTAEALRDGWYDTGDIACLDEDGFLRITDRLSRFSKVGGEMVPHIKVEEAINEILGSYACCVTSLPDEAKGERLVVLYTRREIEPRQLWEMLSDSGKLPKLWIPKPENFYPVESIPVMGSGKLDARQAKALAQRMG